jgi:NADH dehydrogenase [ubiquinone] 1 alpha subcomplex assembly factor 3
VRNCCVYSARSFASKKERDTSKDYQDKSKDFDKKKDYASGLGKGVSILDEEALDSTGKRRIQIKAYGDRVFLVDEILARQSVILMPHSFLLWNARTFEDISIESLAIFPFLFPGIEMLIIGCGKTQPKQLDPDIVRFFRSNGIVVEASNTVNASANFNVLNAEGRNVCAALLTLEPTIDAPGVDSEEFE